MSLFEMLSAVCLKISVTHRLMKIALHGKNSSAQRKLRLSIPRYFGSRSSMLRGDTGELPWSDYEHAETTRQRVHVSKIYMVLLSDDEMKANRNFVQDCDNRRHRGGGQDGTCSRDQTDYCWDTCGV